MMMSDDSAPSGAEGTRATPDPDWAMEEARFRGLFVRVAPDESSAQMGISPEYSGDVRVARAFLEREGVLAGIHDAALAQAVRTVAESGEPFKFEVASIVKPCDAVDGRIDWMVELPGVHEKAARDIDETRTVDHREVDAITCVEAGQTLAVRIPPQPAKTGCTVSGREISPVKRQPVDASLRVGENVREESNRYIAECDGVVTYEKRVLRVLDYLDVPGDVDYSVGNIRFGGPVNVRGSVLPGFRVESTGDVVIGEHVNDATVLAGGNVTVQGGVLGMGRGLIRAEGGIEARYVENSRLEAGGNITVASHIMRSEVYADGAVNVSSGKGAIIGGRVRSAQGIQLNTLGSQNVQGTVVSLGGSRELEDHLESARTELHEVKNRLQQIASEVGARAVEAFRKHPERVEAIAREINRPNLLQIQLIWDDFAAQEQALEEKKKELERELASTMKGMILVTKQVHEGSVVEIGPVVKTLSESIGRQSFYLDPETGDIVSSQKTLTMARKE